MDLSPYLAFVLVVFGPEHGPFAWHHSRAGLLLRVCPLRPMTSSGVQIDEVRRHRGIGYGRLIKKYGPSPSLEQMRAYHRGDFTDPGSLSVAMTRPGRGTVSVTEIEVTPDEVRMSYFPGNPSATRLVSPAASVRVARRPRLLFVPEPLSLGRRTFSLADIFREKNPSWSAKVPGPAFGLLDAVLGTRRINQTLFDLGAVTANSFAERALAALRLEARVHGATFTSVEHEGSQAPIYVANHPLGGGDGLALLTVVRHLHGQVAAPVNDILLLIPHTRSFGVGIDKSRTKKSLPETIERLFSTAGPVVVFPSGATSRKQKGLLRDGTWGRMVVQQALRRQRPIVPVFLSGNNSKFFYSVARARKVLGIGANLEMFLLPREMLAPSVDAIDIKLGQALSPAQVSELASTDLRRAAALRDICYALEESGIGS